MAVGRPQSMGNTAAGKSMRFDLGAVGKSVGSWFQEKALPWLRDTAAPQALGLIDPSLEKAYTNAKDKVVAGKDWEDVVGGVADDLTGKGGAVEKAADLTGLGGLYSAAQQGVDTGKKITGTTTEGVLRGITGRKRKAEPDSIGPATGKRGWW